MDHAAYVASKRRMAAITASKVLSGDLDILEGSRVLSGLRSEVEVSDDDPDFAAFALIASETDNLPVGDARRLWSQTALDTLDPELNRARAWATVTGEEALRNVVSRFNGV